LGIILVSVLLVRQVVAGLASDERGLPEAIMALLVGPYAPLFWGRVALGLVLPAILVAFPWGRRPGVIFTASILALGGIAIDRFLLVAAGQVAPITTASGSVSYPYAPYSPTVVELAIFVGAGAFMAFCYTLAERYLDMGEGDQHIFFAWPWIKKHEHEDEAEHEHEAPAPDAGVVTGVPAGAAGAGS
ncbi:MAG TPA: NrfD/PsrC family molybdoenzyme membrane anchor subunit, partial [Candidatus Limnocylindrales bacterium]|nr:NrfD/PsrC family molybdoenzyme membrane anchor subunit [Candidatus Limnocylindrales bacterium]